MSGVNLVVSGGRGREGRGGEGEREMRVITLTWSSTAFRAELKCFLKCPMCNLYMAPCQG